MLLGRLFIASIDVLQMIHQLLIVLKNGGGRPTLITESLMSEVFSALREDARLTIWNIAVQLDIGNATAHKLMTENLNIERMCAHWVPMLLTKTTVSRECQHHRLFQEMESRW